MPPAETARAAAARELRVPVLRRLCQKLGITVAAREYDFDGAAPFSSDDICDTTALTRGTVTPLPLPEAQELVTRARLFLQSGRPREALEPLHEGIMLLQQTVGYFHPSVAHAYSLFATLMTQNSDVEPAIVHAERAAAIAEAVHGSDHSEVLRMRIDVARLYQVVGRIDDALLILRRTLRTLALVSGPRNPEIAQLRLLMSTMLSECGHVGGALHCLREAEADARAHGDAVQLVAVLQQMAGVLDGVGQTQSAVRMQREAHALARQCFGDAAQQTLVARQLVRHYLQRTVAGEKQREADAAAKLLAEGAAVAANKAAEGSAAHKKRGKNRRKGR